MSLIDDWKYKYGLHRLRNNFRKPDDRAIVCNLREAKSVGVVYNATLEEDFLLVKAFVYELKKIVPEIYSLGFVDKKELENFHMQPLDFFFYCNSDLNWYHKPEEGTVKKFVQKDFDILIDLNLTENLSVRFVLAEPPTPFKVGRFTDIEPNYFDLMLDIPIPEKKKDDEEEGKENVLKFFIEQVKVYLDMIKHG